MSPAEARLQEVPSGMTEAEWNQRVNLAACYRLIAHYGWDDLVDTHISARVPGPEHHFLINPYGLMFDEITASSLIKIDHDGKAQPRDVKMGPQLGSEWVVEHGLSPGDVVVVDGTQKLKAGVRVQAQPLQQTAIAGVGPHAP